jgi:hypothetical protein
LEVVDYKVLKEPGAYKIVCSEEIRRLRGADPEGILVIGESVNLRNRVGQFIRTVIDEKNSSHSEGVTFYNLGMSTRFPVSTLRFKFAVTGTKAEAEALEAKTMKAYEDRHWEFPPLNFKSPKSEYYSKGT